MHNLISIGIMPEPLIKIGKHQHSVWEIVYYFYGSGVITVGNENIPFEPHTIICIPPHTPHLETSQSSFRDIFFSVQTFDAYNGSIQKYTDNSDMDFYNLLLIIHKEFHKKQKNWQKITESLLDSLYQYMVAWKSQKRTNPYVEKFENLLISNISNTDFSIDNAMKEIPLNDDYFRSLFKKEVVKTPLQYITEKRMEYAKILLEDRKINHRKIIDIAKLTGFDDPYYFSRVFKRYCRKSPTEWP